MLEILLRLTNEETTILRNCISDLGTSEKVGISVQLKIANAILDGVAINPHPELDDN